MNDKFEIPISLIRGNPSRVILADYPQPYRSVFNHGDSRHDKYGPISNEDNAIFQNGLVRNEPTRKHLDWVDSQICNQGSVTIKRKEITNKIGF